MKIESGGKKNRMQKNCSCKNYSYLLQHKGVAMDLCHLRTEEVKELRGQSVKRINYVTIEITNN